MEVSRSSAIGLVAALRGGTLGLIWHAKHINLGPQRLANSVASNVVRTIRG